MVANNSVLKKVSLGPSYSVVMSQIVKLGNPGLNSARNISYFKITGTPY